MFLILHIKNRQDALWLLVKNNKVVARVNFVLSAEEDTVLHHLYKILYKNKISISRVDSLVLLVTEASLTQVKVVTAIINVLAWQNKAKVVADYHFSGVVEDRLLNLSNKFKKIKKFKALKVVYSRPPEITISQKKPKFTINKK